MGEEVLHKIRSLEAGLVEPVCSLETRMCCLDTCFQVAIEETLYGVDMDRWSLRSRFPFGCKNIISLTGAHRVRSTDQVCSCRAERNLALSG